MQAVCKRGKGLLLRVQRRIECTYLYPLFFILGEKMSVIEEEKEEKPKRRTFKRSATVVFEVGYGVLPVFKELLKTFESAINDELPFEIHPNQLIIKCLDVSRVKMAKYWLSKNIFEEWDVNGKIKAEDFPIRFTVPVNEVLYALDKISKEARARFEANIIYEEWTETIKGVEVRKPPFCPKCGLPTVYNQLPPEKRGKRKQTKKYKCKCGWRGKVRIWTRTEKVKHREFSSDSELKITVKDKTEQTYEIKLFPYEPEDVPEPKILFDAKFKVDSKEFREILDKMSKRCENFDIVGKDNEFKLKGEGENVKITIEAKRHSVVLLDGETNGEVKARYSIGHVLSVMPKPKIAQVVSLEYANDMPLKLTWFIDSFGAEGLAEFYIAPLIVCD